MMKCISSVIEFSTLECDVEVANQFLQLACSLIDLPTIPTTQLIRFLIEVNSQPVLLEYIENSMVESNYNLAVNIINKVFNKLLKDTNNSSLINHPFYHFIQSSHSTLHHHHQDDNHSHNPNSTSAIEDFFNFDNEDYDCQCC